MTAPVAAVGWADGLCVGYLWSQVLALCVWVCYLMGCDAR